MAADRGIPIAATRLLDALTPASGAAVMGTGIVSVALALDGQELLSRILLVVTAVMWIALGALVPVRALRDRARFARDVRTPAALTSVAGTAVLGARLTQLGWAWAGAGALVIAVALWLALIGPVLRHWSTPTIGASLMLTVGTESLAVLAAELATREQAPWLLDASLVPFALGLASYVFVLRHFDVRHLVSGLGDHWVTGGALAISTLAAAEITLGAQELDMLAGATGLLKAVSLALWAVTLLWLPVLLVSEARWPRLRYDVRRWATVFPVGMYAACTFAMGAVDPGSSIAGFARVWVWIAVAVWALVAAGLVGTAMTLFPSRWYKKSGFDIPPGGGG